MKNSNDTIGNRTRDLPGCGAVPQPTAPPRGLTVRLVQTEVRARHNTQQVGSHQSSNLTRMWAGIRFRRHLCYRILRHCQLQNGVSAGDRGAP
jgi:hypothetical protein